VVLCCVVGVARVRAGRALSHRRLMQVAGVLVVVFLGSYLLKVSLLGREDRSLWSASEHWLLYVHELCIVVMLIAGGVAGLRARRFGEIRDDANPAPNAEAADRRVHRLAGRVAVTASVLALLTAAGVLMGMYSRAGF
jgi:uncharacterized membrane protein YozB (DUF420 family)